MNNTPSTNTPSTNEQNNIADSGLIFYGVKDVARILQCSVPIAREIMKRKDFPLIVVGKSHKVSKTALEHWAMERRD